MDHYHSFIVFRDHGGTWFAAPPNFRNLLRDPIGRGETRVEAMQELLGHPEFIHRARMGEWPLYPGADAFVEVVPNGAAFTSFGSLLPHLNCGRRGQAPRLRLVWNRDAHIQHC